jgi:hypothetical protein
MQNPFYGYGTIVLGQRLVGRDHDIQRFTDYLSSYSGSLSVIGEHRMGKSSLLYEILERITKAKVNFCYTWLDISTLPNSIMAFREMLEGLLECLEGQGQPLPESLGPVRQRDSADSYSAYRRCQQGLNLLRKAGISSLIVLDEFDAVRQFEEPESFIRRLRALIDARHTTGLSVVTISRRSLLAIEKQLGGISNLDGVCEKHYVTPLGDEGLSEIVKRCGEVWQPSAEEYELLRWYTGGHPYLAEMILCHSWEAQSVSVGIEKSTANILDHYQHLRDLLTEDDLFEQLLQITVGPRWNLKTESLARLKQYGLIKPVSGENGTHQYRGWSEHFQAYLEKCSREIPLWEIWKTTENTLRDLIESVCYQELGADWLNKLCKRHESVKKIIEGYELEEADGRKRKIEGCQDRMLKEQRHFGLSASDRILEYTYPADLWTIIGAEWKTFQDFLGGKNKNTKYWGERFALLAKIRNPIAHNREYVVSEHELTLVQAYCKEILAAINKE